MPDVGSRANHAAKAFGAQQLSGWEGAVRWNPELVTCPVTMAGVCTSEPPFPPPQVVNELSLERA